MLLNDFFHINDLQAEGLDVKASITINAAHKIFEGHFPGHPVVPGVCMMQMLKEILEEVTQKKINLIKAHDMKFLALIDPGQNNNIQASLRYVIETDGTMILHATLFKDELTHFKFKGQFDFQ